jgi:hypothetical protein
MTTKKGANVISAVHHLKMAKEFLEDFCRQHKASIGERLFKQYIHKIDWIFRDMVTCNVVGEFVREGIKKEIASDVFSVPAIMEKIALLNPEQRDGMEQVIDALLKGEKIEVKMYEGAYIQGQ